MNKLTIEGFVDGINMSLVIPMNGQDIYIESPMSFLNLRAQDFSTKHLINGVDFNTWFSDALKYRDTQLQVIKGYWQVNQLTVKESILGDDYINGRSLKRLLGAYESNRQFLQQYESELQLAYWKMCSRVKEYFSSPLRVGCSFKHLEQVIEMGFPGVSSILVFRHLEDYYMILSSGCSSRLLVWDATVFHEVDIIHTGNVIKWTYVPSNSHQMHLVALNGADFCPNAPVNGIWVANGQKKLILAKQLTPTIVSDVQVSPQKRNAFYVIIESRILEFNVPQLQVTNEWILPSGPTNSFKFLPSAYDTPEILATNGVVIHPIPIKASNRFKRHWLKFGARSKRVEEKYRFMNEMAFMNKSAFMKLARETILSQKMKLISKFIRPTALPTDDEDEKRMLPSNETATENPNVGGAIFDDIQDMINNGVGIFTDQSGNVLKHFDAKYDVEGILDALEDNLLKSTAEGSRPEDSDVVGGALFDNLQNLIRGGSEEFVDLSANILSELDKKIDIEELLERAAQGSDVQDVHVGNQSSNYRYSSGMDNSVGRYTTNILSHDGEVVALNVGSGRQIRTIYGVYNSQKSTAGSDLILIYENLFIDSPSQTIPCNRPSSLTSWQMDQETLLIFLENQIKVQIYVFRGMIGFKSYLQVDLPYPVDYLRTAILPWAPCGCLSHFLTAVSKKNLMLLKAETVGNCINEEIECNEY